MHWKTLTAQSLQEVYGQFPSSPQNECCLSALGRRFRTVSRDAGCRVIGQRLRSAGRRRLYRFIADPEDDLETRLASLKRTKCPACTTRRRGCRVAADD